MGMGSEGGARVKGLRLSKSSTYALLFFLLNGLLILAFFLPNLSDINPWDEAAYYTSGMSLIEEGEIPKLAGNPLTTLVFGLTYLPFRSSTQWMLRSITLGRLILFALLWLSTYLVAKEFEEHAHPLVALGFLFVTPLSLEMMHFPSDPLFAALAGLSLWQLLRFKRDPEPKYLAVASIFMALAGLARNDGLVQFVFLIAITGLLVFRKPNWWRSIRAVILPFLLIVGGFVLLQGAATGDFNLGINERTYTNFESGQQVIYQGPGEMGSVVESRLEARRLFGTPEENANSVFRAISNNPEAYFDRLIAVAKGLPGIALEAYGKRFGIVLFYFAVRGILELLQKKQYLHVAILVIWPLHLLTGFIITLFRPGHLQFPFYVVFIFASIGLVTTIGNLQNRNERMAISVFMLGLIGYGLIDSKLAIFYGAVVTLTALWTIVLLRELGNLPRLGDLLILFSAGLILRGGYPSPKMPIYGEDPKEQAVAFLSETFPQGTYVGAGSPGVVWASKMDYAGISASDAPVDRSSEDFIDWMKEQGIEVIYVDHSLYNGAPKVWELIEPQIGHGLERIFILEQGNYQVLEMTE
jgi:hypothetical protein